MGVLVIRTLQVGLCSRAPDLEAPMLAEPHLSATFVFMGMRKNLANILSALLHTLHHAWRWLNFSGFRVMKY